MRSVSAHAASEDRDLGIGPILFGSTILIVGLCISSIAIDNHFRSAHLSAAVNENEELLPNRSPVAQTSDLAATPSQASALPDTKIASAAEQELTEHLTDSMPMIDLTAIAPPASGMELPAPPYSFPEEIITKASPSPSEPSFASNQPEIADNAVWRIQLMSITKLANVERAWKKLQQENRDLLGELTLYVEEAKLSKGTFFRMQAGSLPNRAEALALCNSLQSRNQDCIVVVPSGNLPWAR